MEVEKLSKSPPAVLALFLLILGSVYLFINFFGYTFVPFNRLVLDGCIAAVTVFLTLLGLKRRKRKTKSATVFALILPIIAIFFVLTKIVTSDINEIESYLYVVCFYVVLICSMIIFFACGSGEIIKLLLGIVYSVLLIPVFLILFIMIPFMNLGSNTVIKSEMSPNSIYLAEIINSDQGALGGDTIVNVTRQNCDINLLIGRLKKDPKRVYTGRWHEFFTMTLRWETDEILYVNETKYIITKTGGIIYGS